MKLPIRLLLPGKIFGSLNVKAELMIKGRLLFLNRWGTENVEMTIEKFTVKEVS